MEGRVTQQSWIHPPWPLRAAHLVMAECVKFTNALAAKTAWSRHAIPGTPRIPPDAGVPDRSTGRGLPPRLLARRGS